MNPETRLMLINYYQGLADGLRQGTLQFTQEQALMILRGIAPTESESQRRLRLCNITQACRYLGISQPTFRKLVREGTLPQGQKIAGFREKIWYKEDIEHYASQHTSDK